ncbi:hypothetical protein WI36_05225 [Burkholderia ubonensis]|uniref:hypothetical protein n=1 Tax=Burkholderia ubonensis TaxID=101571 RepID=UPI00075888D3|nr:hypothetical protein [Burkholderia ubonensis]KUZ81454.1 hypothetical protein WI36_05225 [Burkholderia ubonensis]
MSTCTAPARRDAVSPLHRWLAIAVLAVATFTIVVTEFAPIGLLSSIAADLHARPATVGLIVSAYAWIGAGSALLSAVLPNHFPRKPLLIGVRGGKHGKHGTRGSRAHRPAASSACASACANAHACGQ